MSLFHKILSLKNKRDISEVNEKLKNMSEDLINKIKQELQEKVEVAVSKYLKNSEKIT